jgi:3-hydroxyacyl-[acyl-carrier-protein] dehydratase
VQHVIVGYKDVRPDEFWVRGHMPDYPLMPGVLMCEAAAQLCSFYMISQKLVHTEFLGFGGLEKTRFRHPVHPGDRLVLVGKAEKLNRRQMTFDVQGIVGSKMVFQAEVIGMPMSKKEAVS